MFEKRIKFGCGFIVIFFVVMICIAMWSPWFASGVVSSDQEDSAPEITMMASPKTLHISKFTVEDVLEDGSAVAHVEDYSADIDFMGKVLFQNDGTDRNMQVFRYHHSGNQNHKIEEVCRIKV